MAEKSPVPAPSGESAPPASPATNLAVQPSLNGVVNRDLSTPTAPPFDLKGWLTAKAINLGVLLALWAVAFAVLRLLVGWGTKDSIGFATIIALLAGFFVRSLLPLPKVATASGSAPSPQPTDSVREVIETVVFVVVLVLLLKSFAAEAFVIPTGSMAETLYGYQKVVTCPQCQNEFPVNCSSEVEPQEGQAPTRVESCVCPNCRLHIDLVRHNWVGLLDRFSQRVWLTPDGKTQRQPPNGINEVADPGWNSGDRVLVAKFVYDLLGKRPERLDVVVFKFPGDDGREYFPRSGPIKKHVPMNYIKRLIGLPGETIAIHHGNLYVLSPEDSLQHDDYEHARHNPAQMLQLWRAPSMHSRTWHFGTDVGDDDAQRKQLAERFAAGKFQIIRKPPAALLAMMRLVYDNDRQAADLRSPEYARWVGDEGWSTDNDSAFQTDGSTEGPRWLRYRHVLRPAPDSRLPRRQLITDFMGYNTWRGGEQKGPAENWASDLIAECDLTVGKPQGHFVMELSRGPDRFQAKFDLSNGDCTLYRVGGAARAERGKGVWADAAPVKLVTGKADVSRPGNYRLRFANVDDRLTVWVNDRLIFGDGHEYEGSKGVAPVEANDLERPASLASEGAAVRVSKLKLFRDTYYTTNRGGHPDKVDLEEFKPSDPSTFKHYATAPVATYFVQPDHYLCLGDNSPESSDGRSWGLVPQRLMLGRALMVYYPFSRTGRIR